MPDEKKKKKLREINYTIPNVCGLCLFGEFGGTVWGKCKVHTYNHKKHTGDYHFISIHSFGSCESFKENPLWNGMLGAHSEFRVEGDE